MSYPRLTAQRRVERRAAGFTLVEILAVIGILVLIASITLPALVKSRKTAARAKTALDLQAISTALEEYKNSNGQYPQTNGATDGCTVLFQELTGTKYDVPSKSFL